MAAEVHDCPKGWGHVIFMEKNMCPISGAGYCITCRIGTKKEYLDEDWKRLQQEKIYKAQGG